MAVYTLPDLDYDYTMTSTTTPTFRVLTPP